MKATVRDVMTASVIAVRGDTSFKEMVALLGSSRASARPDDDIWREVTDQVILRSFLVDPARFDVTVQSGIVTLSGRPESDQVGQEIVDAVSHVQGVVTVRDRLEYAGGR